MFTNYVTLVISHVFYVRKAHPEMTASFIVDDSQIFLTWPVNVSPALKRLALTGRSRGLELYLFHIL